MQEAKQTFPQLPQLSCTRLNKATMFCASSKCKQSALSCMRHDCQGCKQTHKKCLLYDAKTLIQQISSKKQTITPQVKKAIEALQKIYDESIEKLSIQKELISAKIQLFGLNEFEIELIRKIQDGLANEIQGKLVIKTLKNLNVKKQFQATDQSIIKFWNKRKSTFDQLFEKLKLMTYKKPNYLESLITQEMQSISCFFKQPILSAQLLYRASQNAFSVQKFHQICDGVPNTLLLFKTEYDYIGGGYTPLAWNSNSAYLRDDQAKTFIFSVTNNQRYKLTMPEYTIYCSSGYGPTFGGGHDIYITNAADANRTSYFNVPHSYNVEEVETIPVKQGSQDSDFVDEQKDDSGAESPKKKVNKLNQTKGVLNPRNFIGSSSDYYSRLTQWEIFKIQF